MIVRAALLFVLCATQLVLVACTAGLANEPPEGDMFCGSIGGELAGFYWSAGAGPTACFLMRFEDNNARGTFVDDTHTGPTRVHWYLPLPVPGEADTTEGGGECVGSGVDADGADNGWSVTLDDGHCTMPAFDVQGHDNTARMHTLASSTLTLVDGVWQRRGHVWAYDYYYADSGTLDSTGDFSFPLGMALDGVAEPATVGWPVQPDGDCAVDGCWSASDWTGEMLEGDGSPNCAEEVDAIVGGIGEQLYDVARGGHRLWWANTGTWKHLVRAPDTCTFGRNTSENWTTAIDHDAGEVAATFRGNVYREAGQPQFQWCVLRFRSPIVAGTGCVGEPHPG